MGDKSQPENVVAEIQGHEKNNEERVFYRRVFFQALIVGACAFLAPGLYNAMQSTGAAGQQTPYLVMYEYSD